MRCAGRLLKTKGERRLAFFFMRYGPWKSVDTAQLKDDKISAVTFEVFPEVPDKNEGFENLGFLSSLFSSYFNEATLSEDMTVRALGTTSESGSIGTLIPAGYQSKRLPVWRFVLKVGGKDHVDR
jgi:hypothetical protein